MPDKRHPFILKYVIMKNLRILYPIFLVLFILSACEKTPKEEKILKLDQGSISFNEEGGSSSISVTANSTWSVSVENGAWIEISPLSGSNNGSFSVTASANTSDSPRTAIIKVSSQQLTQSVAVQQAGQSAPAYTSISTVRALYKGTDVKVTGNVLVKGTVVSNYRHTDNGGLNNYTSQKAIVIQDETAGIQLFCAENNTAFAIGDEVEVNLTGQTLSVYNKGPLQVNGIALNSITKVGTQTLTPKEITAAQLVSGNFESMYVAVKDVQIAASDIGKTFSTTNSHTSINFVAKTGETFVIFSSKYSSFYDKKVPTGSGTLKGVAARYGDVIQISITSLDDVASLTGSRFSVGGEGAKVKSIAEVRALYKGSDVTINDDIAIEGVVISDYRRDTNGGLNNYTTAKTIVVSDGVTGIQLYCTSDNIDFARGDKVKVSLKGQTLSVYEDGPIQVNGLPIDNIAKTGTAAVTAKSITVKELLTGAYESVYVSIADVQVIDDDLDKTFATSEEHRSIGVESKTGETFDIFTSKYAVFRDTKVPQGSGTLKGIAGKHGTRFQLSIADKSDYASLTGTRFYTGPKFSLQFNAITVTGDAGQFDVNLAANVAWTATSSDSNFKVSQTSGDKSKMLTISYNDNPSSSATRVAIITFTTTDAAVTDKELKLIITQQAYQVLKSDAVMNWLELPAITPKERFAYVSHDTQLSGKTVRSFSMWYDADNRFSQWVAYPLYSSIMGSGSRSDSWDYDPKVPQRDQAALFKSFGVSGYDRGHQLPSADRLATEEANKATFYFTNITAQNSTLNANIWGSLEGKIRSWVSSSDTLYVVTGAVAQTSKDTNIEYLKDNDGKNVAIPKAYFKVVLKYSKSASQNGGYSAIGFWFENKAYTDTNISAYYAKSVKEIEALTGFNFFHNLDDEIEKAVESSYSPSSWGL